MIFFLKGGGLGNWIAGFKGFKVVGEMDSNGCFPGFC